MLTRRAEHLGVETFALGRAILDGTAGDYDEARARGRALLDRSEATMEALYAVERKAMSARLSRVGGDGPLGLRP